MSQQLLFFFSALGAFNGLLFALYFLFSARTNTLSWRLFGGFLLMLSIRVGKSVFFYFYRDLAREYLQLGLTACLFIGPFLFFFVRSLEADLPRGQLRRQIGLHFTILLLVALVGGMLYSYRAEPQLWQWPIIPGIYFIWAAYSLAAAYTGRRFFSRVVRNYRNSSAHDRLVVFSIVGALILVTLYHTASFTNYITGALAFTLLLYCTWAAYLVSTKGVGGEIEEVPPASKPDLLAPSTATLLVQRLEDHMKEDRPYLNPNLKLAELAAALRCTPHQLSTLFNAHLQTGFHEYIAARRISVAEQLLREEDHLTMEAISQSSGFNSRSTFYAAFRRIHGTTPAKWRTDAAL
ncbi:hypothetical protein CEQ90_16925 [Lewinellaceae bacterium SD302]|nr:hypothetical protein CEQ90_16925 [Lewinellaceae bacterium SD302]